MTKHIDETDKSDNYKNIKEIFEKCVDKSLIVR